MKNIISALILVWLPSCGQQPGANSACPDSAVSCETTTTNKPQVNQPSTTPSPDKEEKKKVYVNSYYLNEKSDMPSCDMDHDKHLVYIVKEKVFYACDVFSWVQVSIKGDKGDSIIGPQGPQGSQGVAGQVVNSNMWYDAVTSKYWLLPMAYVAGNTASEANYCGSNYRVPTYSELQQANARGLSVAADAINAIKEAYYGSSYQNYVVRTGGNASATTSGYYCIQK